MKTLKLIPILFCFVSFSQNQDSITLKKIYNFYLTKSKCYSNLEHLATKIGGRLSGSPQAEQAVIWAKKAMYEAGADTVILQPCMVPHWVRGKKEKCNLSSAKLKINKPLNCIALGNCVGTGPQGVNATVIEVTSFEDLEDLGEANVKGKIVFYNVFFDQTHVKTGSAYGESVKYRSKGASYAAKYGAVGSVVRSMTSAPSFNVVGQITGTEKPNEFIIAGGHLDSWDNGQGAHDDGTGVVQSIEILSVYKLLGIKPKHSIRAVAFMNEENGLAGGEAYAKYAKEKNEKHIAALETDAGGFTPRGFGVDTTNGLYNLVVKWRSLFAPYYVERIEKGGGGADLMALEKLGVPCIDIHHTAQDTFDKVNKRELELGSAGIGALIYLLDKYK